MALVPRYAVAEDLASGTLISLLNRFRVPSRMLFAIYPEPEITSAKLRVFIDYLTKWMVTRGIGRMS